MLKITKKTLRNAGLLIALLSFGIGGLGLYCYLKGFSVSLHWFHDDIQSALQNKDLPLSVQFGDLELAWTPNTLGPKLLAANVAVKNDRNETILTVEQIRVELKILDLFRGHITIESISIEQPTLAVERSKDGEIHALMIHDDASKTKQATGLNKIIKILQTSNTPTTEKTKLPAIKIIDANLQFSDEISKGHWEFSKFNFAMTPLANGEIDALLSGKTSAGSHILSLTGSARCDQSFSCKIRGDLFDANISAIKSLWPKILAEGIRSWIETGVLTGKIPHAWVDVELKNSDEKINFAKLNGGFDFREVDVAYFKPLARAENASGKAWFSQEGFGITKATGTVSGLSVKDITLSIKDSEPHTILALNAKISGNASDAIKFLESKPIELHQIVPLRSEEVQGGIQADLVLNLPLYDDTEYDDATILVDGNSENLTTNKIFGGQQLQHSPVTFAYHHEKSQTTLDIKTEKAHLSDPYNIISGKGSVEIQYRDMPKLPNDIKVRFAMNDSKTAPGLKGLVTAKSKEVEISLSGALIDARAGLKQLEVNKGEAAQSEPNDLKITLNLENISKLKIADETNILQNVSGKTEISNGKVSDINLSAKLGKLSKSLFVSIEKAYEGRNQFLKVTSDDAGATFKAIGVFSEMEGGDLTLRAPIANGNISDWNDALLEISYFHLDRMPMLLGILSASSMHSMTRTVSREGADFNMLTTRFDFSAAKLVVKKFFMHGSLLGLRLTDGNLDRTSNKMEFNGIVLPARFVSSLINRVPLVGDKIVDENGQGLFGVKFRVSGTTTDSKVKVSALSGFTPKFLQDLFSI